MSTQPIDFSQYEAKPTTPPPIDFSKYETPTNDDSLWGKIKSALTPRPVDAEDKLMGTTPPKGPLGMPGSTEGPGLLNGLAEYDKASGGEIGGGVHDISRGDIAKGLHRVISGFMAAATPAAPFILPAAASAPIGTGLGIAGGIAGQKAASGIAGGVGATPDQQALAGDVGGIAGGVIGGAIPGVAGKAALLGKTPEEAYQSALKPSTTIPPAKVASIVQTGLTNEIPVSKAGAEKLSSLMEDLDDKVAAGIGSGKGKTIDPQAVAQRADAVKAKFANQVNPTADLQAIDASKQEFLANNQKPIPAADAQAMKQGTYQQLSGKYGELGAATTEAQKALARGLKEELENAFPELRDLNSQLSKAYDLQPILEKAVQRQGNHQIMGIGTPIVTGATKAVTGSNVLATAAGALKTVVDNPVVKSRLAIALNKSGVPWLAAQARISAYAGALAGAASSSNDATQDGHGSSPAQ